jgi:phosphoadenosine phosphosulfate reductase
MSSPLPAIPHPAAQAGRPSASGPPDGLDLDALNPMLEAQPPEKIVAWSAAQFGERLVMSSSFGAESALLIHMTISVVPDVKIVFGDTGYLFPETHAFMEQLRRRFNLNVWTYRTKNDPIQYLRHAGEADPTWRNDIDRCCAANKNEPFERAMRDLAPAAWLRGIRRNQAETRRDRQVIEWSPRYNCYAVSPLLNMTSKDIYAYMKRHDLPYHPLYEKGYASIGCNPLSCTRPIMPGEDPRSGRWAGAGKFECGINVDNSLDSAQL